MRVNYGEQICLYLKAVDDAKYWHLHKPCYTFSSISYICQCDVNKELLHGKIQYIVVQLKLLVRSREWLEYYVKQNQSVTSNIYVWQSCPFFWWGFLPQKVHKVWRHIFLRVRLRNFFLRTSELYFAWLINLCKILHILLFVIYPWSSK